jgi:DNA-binding MarR family transcriptional regulator
MARDATPGEATPRPQDEADGIRAWARLMRTSQQALSAVEQSLKEGGFPPLGWYDVLLELRRAGPDGLRAVDLQARLLLAQYNLSRLLDRMAKAGLVRRLPCPDDRRAQILTLTEAGQRLQRDMAPAYLAAVESHFAGKLTAAEHAALLRILGKLDQTD